MKKVVIFILAALMISQNPLGILVDASEPNYEVMPCWENIDGINISLNFSGTTGTASVTVERIYGVTSSIEATLTVYKKVGSSWVYVTSTSGSSTRNLNLAFDFTGISGVTYKAVADVTATGLGGVETDSVSETCTC